MSAEIPLDQASTQRILVALREARARLESAERAAAEPIAVVGLGCRFPGGAHGPDAYWRLLSEGVDAVRPIPPDRYDTAALFDPAPGVPGRIYVREAALLDDIDRFDAAFFDISPREAASLDPQQRLLLEVAYESFEHAGLAPERLRGSRTGVFVGIGRNDYAYRLLAAQPESVTAWHATGNGLCYGPGRLGHALDLRGPNLAVDTACSSSLLAVHLACRSLRLRECDLALAGGCHVHLSPRVTMMLCMSGALAPDGRSKTFDTAADGFGQGEGCGLVVLRRLSDALERGDRILALVRGSAVSHDGHSSGLTVPSPAAQERAIRDALADARVDPHEIGYVEAHGTGTPLGDPIEVEALAAVFGPGRLKSNALHLGSVKTNIGHLEAAAGIAGFAKTVLALQYGVIPPHLHFGRPNPRIPWNDLPIEVASRSTSWARGDTVRLAGVSSFGMSGTNAHVVLQEAPLPEPAAGPERPLHLFTLSARSEVALRRQAARLAAHIESHGALAPGDIAHTLNTGRDGHAVRAAWVAADTQELARHCAELAADDHAPAMWIDDGGEPIETIFLFSGQGAQYPGMGRGLYETWPSFRNLLDRCDALLRPQLGGSLLEVMFGDDGRLDWTLYTQPALFVLEYALADLWRSLGVEPGAAIGHSLGEYAAACAAGALGLEDGLRLVAERARLMQEMPAGRMAAVSAAEERVRQILETCGARVEIAAVNGSSNVTIAGHETALAVVLDRCTAEGLETRVLKVARAFHSAAIEPAIVPFAEAARRATYAAPRLALISNVTGDLHADAPSADYWAQQMRRPVRFAEGLETLLGRGARVLVEIGPGSTLLGLAAKQLGERPALLLPSIKAGQDEWRVLLASLGRLYEAGLPIDWGGLERDCPRRRPVALPTYPFERRRHWCEEPSDQAVASRPVPAYRTVWREWTQPARPVQGPVLAQRRWLLLADSYGLAQRFGRMLAKQGAEVILVRPGDAFARRGSADWTVDPSRADDLARLLRELSASSEETGILSLWSAEVGPEQEPDAERMEAFQLQAAAGLLHLVQALAGCGLQGARLWVATRNAVALEGEAALPSLIQTSVWGMAKAIALEYPDLWGGIIDLSVEPGDAELAELLAILAEDGGEDHLLLRGARRLRGRIEPLDEPASKSPKPVRSDGSYLIAGGLGALGLRVARWLAEQGAAALVLLGRRPPSPEAQRQIDALRGAGTAVLVASADVAEAEDIERVLASVETGLPPLRGVVHAAGLPGQRDLVDLDVETLRAVLRPKVRGAWQLHRQTAHLGLDWFVAFSSVAALWGSKGQAHYAAANYFLDALADYRRRLGLPALSLAWGPWDGGGMASAEGRDWLARVGVRALDPDRAIAAIASRLGSRQVRIALAEVDWARFRGPYESRRSRPLLETLWPAAQTAESGGAEAPLAHRLARLHGQERHDWLVAHLQQDVASVLGLPEGERPDPRKGFSRLGMDSLMAMDLQKRLARGFGVPLGSTVAFDYPNVFELAEYLAERVLGHGPEPVPEDPAAASPQPKPAPAEDAPSGAAIAEKLARLESLMSEDQSRP